MNEGKTLSWSAPEYEEKGKTSDWFWALGVIAVTGGLTAFIFGNIFFGILIFISGGLLFAFAKKSPEWIEYELVEKGLRVKSHLYLYKNIHAFWVDGSAEPHLFVKTERLFMPTLSIPIDLAKADEIEKFLSEKGVAKEEMRHHPSEKILERLGI